MKPTVRVSLTASHAGENHQGNIPEHTMLSGIVKDPIFRRNHGRADHAAAHYCCKTSSMESGRWGQQATQTRAIAVRRMNKWAATHATSRFSKVQSHRAESLNESTDALADAAAELDKSRPMLLDLEAIYLRHQPRACLHSCIYSGENGFEQRHLNVAIARRSTSSVELTSALALSSDRATTSFPASEAWCSGVRPSCKVWAGGLSDLQ